MNKNVLDTKVTGMFTKLTKKFTKLSKCTNMNNKLPCKGRS